MELLVATRNAGKLREIRNLFEGEGLKVLGLEDFPDLPEVVEDGKSFAENALKKAKEISSLTGRMVLADDSGLEVEALGGLPGVMSARFSGPGANDASNNQKLLNEMEGVPSQERKAAFHCAMALVVDDDVYEVNGRVEGMILDKPSGSGGFGYDPLFWLPDHKMTMAEIPVSLKNKLSHRGQALSKILPVLKNLIT